MGVTALAATSAAAISGRTAQELSNVFLKQRLDAVEGIVEVIKDSTRRSAEAGARAVDIVV